MIAGAGEPFPTDATGTDGAGTGTAAAVAGTRAVVGAAAEVRAGVRAATAAG
jgi:hypothetical protein